MSYLIREVDIDFKTGKSTLISEKIVEGDYLHGQKDLLVKFLAESCLKAIQEEQRQNAQEGNE